MTTNERAALVWPCGDPRAACSAPPLPAAHRSAWRNAAPGRNPPLPADHASHPDYRIEWWYYTGNLDATDGRRFGYQLTFFRVGVDPAPVNPSRWAVRDLFMAHFAVTDVAGSGISPPRSSAGPAVGWAGARTRYLSRMELDDWSARLDRWPPPPDRGVAQRLRSALDLSLDEGKPPGLARRSGLQPEGRGAGQRVALLLAHADADRAARSSVDGRALGGDGASWMDHEFGTSFLEKSQTGWDWFSMQLDDGTDLMLYRLRRDRRIDRSAVERDVGRARRAARRG